MSGKNFMSYGDADTILTEFSNDIKSRVSTKANQGLTARQIANAKTNIDIEKVPNVATNDQTPTFLEESSRVNIASGDKLSLIFGKIKKFFSDLKAVAFSGSYNDLSDTPTLVECSTARNVAAKTVTLPGFKLKTGARISVRFTDTSSSNPASGHITLNVNGTGAKKIVDGHTNMSILGATFGWIFNANLVNDFIYDGTYWVWMNRDNNTTYSSKAAASGGTATSLCTTGEKYTWNNKANTSDIPTTLSGLSDDSTHRLVTDTEKSTWNGKANKKTTMDSYYGTSSTAADTAAKVITVTDDGGNFSLRAGIAITVKFSAVNTAQNPTFNVNNTGAKPVFYNTAVVTTGTLWAGGNTRPARYVYDGTNWVWMGQAIDNNTTYSAMSKGELTTGTATSLRTVRADYLKAGINSLIDTKIAGLDVSSVGGTGKYISEISETDGKISATASNMPTIPTKLSDLSDDATHRVVTDTEKSTWNNKCEGGSTTAIATSITAQMDALKASGKSGVFPFCISSGNADFSTTGYCMAIGAIRNGGVSTITAVNSQTGDIWTNGNTSQGAGAWRGWKKIGGAGSVIVEKLSVTGMATVTAGGVGSISVTATKQGYTPIGIVGTYLNKPSWEQHYPYLAIAGSYIYKSGSNYYAEVLLYNPTTSGANFTGDIYVLYVKD